MKKIYKNIAVAATLTLSCVAAQAQASLTSYFMPNAVESMQHNAAFAPDRGYFNIPVVGSLSLNSTGNVAMGDIFVSGSDGLVTIFDTSVSANDALSGMKDVNTFGISNRMGILGFGKYSKNKTSFWSFDINLRTSTSLSMPYEMVEFFKTAPESTTIEDVNIYLESYAEVAFGYSRMVSDKLTIGGRVKALVGLAYASLNIDKMDINMNSEEWLANAEGTFDLYADGMTLESEMNDAGVMEYDLGSIDGTPSGPAGYGVAFDIGATYDLTDHIQLSLGMNDIGFIAWNKGANTHATVANNFSFTGTEYNAGTGESTGSDDLEFDDIVLEAQESQSTTNWLQANLNAGAECKILNDALSVGVIYTADFWKAKTIHTFTMAGSFTPINWFTVAASYGIGSFGANSFGLAANFATGFCNLYVATDVLFSEKCAQMIPINQSKMNVSFGLAVPLGKRGERGI